MYHFCGGDWTETSAKLKVHQIQLSFLLIDSSSTTTTSTTTTTKVLQAPAMKFELNDEILKNETWAYEVQIINFNSKIKAIEYVLYFNEEEIAKDRDGRFCSK